jgi:hypothetical protein
LLLVLEQITNLQKPAIMAAFFSAYLREAITKPFLLMCWDEINMAYIEDLNPLLSQLHDPPKNVAREHMQRLTRTGLSMVAKLTHSTNLPQPHEITDFGRQFVKVYRQAIASAPKSCS